MSKQEAKVYGVSTSLKFAEKQSSKIIRAYFLDSVSKKFSSLMKQLAKEKKVYRIVLESELEKITQSKHHEGVCLVVNHTAPYSLEQWFSQKRKKDVVLFLENISNPHNLGAIMRVCSHFGVSAILHPQPKLLLSGAALRTSEGGFETLSFVECKNFDALARLANKNEYQIFSTSSHLGKSHYEILWPSKLILFFGEEKNGLSKEALAYGECVQIPGTGAVESLNVATAAAVILSEVCRRDFFGSSK